MDWKLWLKYWEGMWPLTGMTRKQWLVRRRALQARR